MEWYKSLNINQRIQVKTCFELLCGTKWEDLSFILSMRDRIELFYEKAKCEGILV
ncbi:MAG: hypothetical protein PHS30_04710 [Bacteroidales bacterium]|nr:hypothetical protein [Bacteroidales bacterium]